MKANMKLGLVGILVSSVLCMGACVGQVDPKGTADPVGEAAQALVTCTSDCSGVPNSQGFSETCVTSCDATDTQITCDGTVIQCPTCSPKMGQTCLVQVCHCGKASQAFYGTVQCDGTCYTSDPYECCCELTGKGWTWC